MTEGLPGSWLSGASGDSWRVASTLAIGPGTSVPVVSEPESEPSTAGGKSRVANTLADGLVSDADVGEEGELALPADSSAASPEPESWRVLSTLGDGPDEI
eukprot:932225-Rhodomonas_salina.1